MDLVAGCLWLRAEVLNLGGVSAELIISSSWKFLLEVLAVACLDVAWTMSSPVCPVAVGDVAVNGDLVKSLDLVGVAASLDLVAIEAIGPPGLDDSCTGSWSRGHVGR